MIRYAVADRDASACAAIYGPYVREGAVSFEETAPTAHQVACAGIALPNDASVRLHEAFGFERVGIYQSIGYKAGAWRDVGWWQLQLALADGAPLEPLTPPAL